MRIFQNFLKLILILVYLITTSFSCSPYKKTPYFFPFLYFLNEGRDYLVADFNSAIPKEFYQGHICALPPEMNLSDKLITYKFLINKEIQLKDYTPESVNEYEDKYKWQKLSEKFTYGEININQYKNIERNQGKIIENYTFLNCNPDCFRHASEQFALKEKNYSLENLKLWVTNQNQVFKNCALNELTLPNPLPDGSSPEQINDYEYQLASSYFYHLDYDKSEELFTKISNNANSPYKDLAFYLIFRSIFRKTYYHNAPNEIFENKYSHLKQRISSSPYRDEIEKLHKYFIIATNPQKEILRITHALMDGPIDQFNVNELRYLANTQNKFFNNHPFLDWVNNLENSKITFEEAFKIWELNSSMPNLILALEKYKFNDAHTNYSSTLINQLNKVEVTSPQYLLAQYYLAKIALIQGNLNQLKSITDSVLEMNNLVIYERNLFRFLRSFTANDYFSYLDDVLLPVVFYLNDWSNEAFNNEDNKIVDLVPYSLNQIQIVPIDYLIKAYNEQKFPLWVRKRFITAAWTRYILLGKTNLADQISKDLIVAFPELQLDLDELQKYKNEKIKRLFAYLIIMRNPGLSIKVEPATWRDEHDILRLSDRSSQSWENWWTSNFQIQTNNFLVNFLHPEALKTAKNEWEQLAKQFKNGIVDFFCTKAINAYSQNPKINFLPEMLHRCVIMSRYNHDYNAPYSSYQAYTILHKFYKNNNFTKLTPYHFYIKK